MFKVKDVFNFKIIPQEQHAYIHVCLGGGGGGGGG